MRLAFAPVLIASLVAFTWLAPTPAAATGLYLSWNDCASAPGAAQSLAGACLNSATEELDAAFELPAPIDSVIALEVVVDVQSNAASLPSWWGYGTGGCRYGMLVASANFLGRTGCADFWQGVATFDGPPVYTVTAPRGAANTARIVMLPAVLSTTPRSLAAATRYYAGRLVFQNDPADGCPGCTVPACLVLNSIRFLRVSGTGEVTLDVPGAPGANQVAWQALTANCSAVPLRRATWGRLKSLYR